VIGYWMTAYECGFIRSMQYIGEMIVDFKNFGDSAAFDLTVFLRDIWPDVKYTIREEAA
jgi:hypothetical protein